MSPRLPPRSSTPTGEKHLMPESLNNAQQARTSSEIETLINTASAGDVIHITPGSYDGVGDLVFPASDVTVLAYGAEIIADSAGISGAPARWPDINGQSEIRVFGGTWNANPTGGDPVLDGVADYGFGNSGGRVRSCRIQDVTLTGFSSMSLRARNWDEGAVSNCHAIDTETGFCAVLCENSSFEGLVCDTFGDTFLLADRNTNCTFSGGAARGDATGCTHGIDAVANTDSRFEGFTIDGAGNATDVVNIRDDAGTPNTGCSFDVRGHNAVSFGVIVRAGAPHEVTLSGEYSGVDVGINLAAGTAVVSAYVHDTNAEGIRTPGGAAIVNGATVDNPGSTGISIEAGEVVSATVRNNASTQPDFLFVTGTHGHGLSPSFVDRSTTDLNGQVVLNWAGRFRFGDAPQLALQLEAANQWYVSGWSNDANGRIDGATIQITDASGTAVASGVAVQSYVAGM